MKEKITNIKTSLSSYRPASFRSKKFMRATLLVALLLVALFGANKLISDTKSDSRVELKDAKGSQDLNREFSYPLRDKDGKEVGSFKLVIEKVELRDELIVKGKRATSIKGRTFLVLNMRVDNGFEKAIKVNTRDYVRLSVNGDENKWLAPDYHNDPVEAQAISSKPTRIGFPINDTDKNLVLQVGEITGDKEKINLELK